MESVAHLDADDIRVEAGDELGEGRPVALHPEEQAIGVPLALPESAAAAGLFLAGEPSLGMGWKKSFIVGGAAAVAPRESD
jgi:hypothetical protein